MAEFVMKDLIAKCGLSDKFYICSSATSGEELGNPMYPPAKEILRRKGVPFFEHYAAKLSPADYGKYDMFIVMDSLNRRNAERIFSGDKENKIHYLLEFDGQNRDVADPWYYGNFEGAYSDILSGCTALLDYLTKK